ncbi:MAG: hypothetical protein SynsKO_09150 [Synoicihabitans sp.]
MKPWLSVSVFSLPALLVSLWPNCHGFLCFDRSAILQGQLWRLWTGHWVHFSSSHLWWNMAAMVVAAAWLEASRPGLLLRFTAVAAPLLSLGLLGFETNMTIYGGLSGVGTGVITLLGIRLIQSPRSDRHIGFGVLGLVIAKLSHDAWSQTSLLSEFGSAHIHSSLSAHVMGAGLALSFHAVGLYRRSTSNAATPPMVGVQSRINE